MLRIRAISPIWAAAAVALAGCHSNPPDPPRLEVSNSAYGTVPFRDDAPANAIVADGSFPQSFVDVDGKSIDLEQYRGKKKVVLVMLRGIAKSERGGFCPSCLSQTASLSANLAAFEEHGAVVNVVFPGPSHRVAEFIESVKVKSVDPKLPCPKMLLDRECVACEQLGIRDDLAKPSTYILDLRGRVVYAYIGETSTDRPSVKAILAHLERIR